MRRALWERALTTTGVDMPFLRVSGLDSQACFGCHNSAGTHVPRGQLHRTQKPGGPGGAADFASVLLANEFFPELEAVSTSVEKDAAAAARGALGVCPNDFYCIDLTNPGTLPDEFLPRLPANRDETVTVPLYSDLKRHDLGPFLAQTTPAQADDAGNPIPNEEWLTTKLWGVADNGPWLHDGRARTLEQAILMHDGEYGNAGMGEAADEVDDFQLLPTADKEALMAFLESLSVPIP